MNFGTDRASTESGKQENRKRRRRLLAKAFGTADEEKSRVPFHLCKPDVLAQARKIRHPRFSGSVILSGKEGDDALPYPREASAKCGAGSEQMKTEDKYLKFVRWSEDDHSYVGYCPDLFPWGGVCHGDDEEQTYRELRELVRKEIEELTSAGKELPKPVTRPMREPAGV